MIINHYGRWKRWRKKTMIKKNVYQKNAGTIQISLFEQPILKNTPKKEWEKIGIFFPMDWSKNNDTKNTKQSRVYKNIALIRDSLEGATLIFIISILQKYLLKRYILILQGRNLPFTTAWRIRCQIIGEQYCHIRKSNRGGC